MITRTNAVSTPVTTAALDPGQVVSGAPVAGERQLPAPPGLEVGIWEHSVGTSTDVEVDEVFVVLSGRATIQPEGGPAVDVGPGDVVTVATATATTWTVHETLRKVFICRA